MKAPCYHFVRPLSRKEQELFNLLYLNLGQLVTHKKIVEELLFERHYWPGEYTRPLVNRLRKKMDGDYIETVRGKGYILHAPRDNSNIIRKV